MCRAIAPSLVALLSNTCGNMRDVISESHIRVMQTICGYIIRQLIVQDLSELTRDHDASEAPQLDSD